MAREMTWMFLNAIIAGAVCGSMTMLLHLHAVTAVVLCFLIGAVAGTTGQPVRFLRKIFDA